MTLTNLQSDIRYLTDTTSTEYSDTDINRNINTAYHMLINEIIDSMDGWDIQFDTAVANLVANQREYLLPSNILTIKKVQLKLDGTNWKEAGFIDPSSLTYPIASESDITSLFSNDTPKVDLGDRSIFIYSGTIIAVTGGIKIWYTREITELSSGSDEPVIAEAYHRGISYAASKDFFQKFGDRARALEMATELEKIIARMKLHYGQKGKEAPLRMTGPGKLEEYE